MHFLAVSGKILCRIPFGVSVMFEYLDIH
jgi:hypothetical protein